MGFKQQTPQSEIDAFIDSQIEQAIEAQIYLLHYVGERCLNAARDVKSYEDQTGNLRSSIGYVISLDGGIVDQSTFKVIKKGEEGAHEGLRYAREKAREFKKGTVLIMVAGMNYAQYVAAKGYDVVDSAELLADRLVPQLMQQLGFH